MNLLAIRAEAHKLAEHEALRQDYTRLPSPALIAALDAASRRGRAPVAQLSLDLTQPQTKEQ